ncbi:hypothetical protein KIW84_075997 [Lathyrus oleraceus]|uniref:Uncharacterized protein n=1 Tax=Pisum sativum TaxID=3888 RepID=A0A9D4VYD6_PEA|nr:hypothetical protein KIW84_075997 [Pisum sativum]
MAIEDNSTYDSNCLPRINDVETIQQQSTLAVPQSITLNHSPICQKLKFPMVKLLQMRCLQPKKLLINWDMQTRHRKRNDNTPKANLAEEDDIIVDVIAQANIMTDVNKWVVDSGATRHICANKYAFTFYTTGEDGEEQVYLDDS